MPWHSIETGFSELLYLGNLLTEVVSIAAKIKELEIWFHTIPNRVAEVMDRLTSSKEEKI